jgi:hypothetical protein
MRGRRSVGRCSGGCNRRWVLRLSGCGVGRDSEDAGGSDLDISSAPSFSTNDGLTRSVISWALCLKEGKYTLGLSDGVEDHDTALGFASGKNRGGFLFHYLGGSCVGDKLRSKGPH